MLVLLYLFNPAVRSLRALQQASTLKSVQRKLGCSRASLGSLSEAVEVLDPQRLYGIIESLAAEIKPVRDVRKNHLTQKLMAVDGSMVKTLESITEAAFMNGSRSRPPGIHPFQKLAQCHQGIALPRGLAGDTSPKRQRVNSGPSLGPAPGSLAPSVGLPRNSLAGASGSYSCNPADVGTKNSLAGASDLHEMPPYRRDGDDSCSAYHITVS